VLNKRQRPHQHRRMPGLSPGLAAVESVQFVGCAREPEDVKPITQAAISVPTHDCDDGPVEDRMATV
jgi:hypothetical protein